MASQTGLAVEGTRLLLHGKPFYYQGLSFFNALYNARFNETEAGRESWLRHFKSCGITALRIWGDFRLTNGWIDEGPDSSLFCYPERTRRDVNYEPQNPKLNADVLGRLKALLTSAERLDMVIELCLFSHYLAYPVNTRDDFIRLIIREIIPYRNILLQIWNEFDMTVLRHYELIKTIDPERVVTNAPGGANVLGKHVDNQVLDVLAPHTIRAEGRFFEEAPVQIRGLIERYGKPVIDDEPARTGTRDFGGTPSCRPEYHIAQLEKVREFGGYHNYHHDMFQLPYGSPATPPSGIPEPEFSDYHAVVFGHLRTIAPPEVTN